MFWGCDEKCAQVIQLVFAHGSCDPQSRGCKGYGLSSELIDFADPLSGLARLADLHVSYSWSPFDSRRLALVCWAIAATGTPQQRREGKKHYAKINRYF